MKNGRNYLMKILVPATVARLPSADVEKRGNRLRELSMGEAC